MPDRLDRIRSAFDQRAERYDDSAMHRGLADTVAQGLDLVGVDTIVDIATGTGLVLRALDRSGSASGIRLVGVDLSPEMLRVARRELPSAEWIEADASHLPLTDGSVDIATCVTALHIIPDVSAALDEWSRVLRPGGHLVTASFASPHLSGITSPTSARPYPTDHDPYAGAEAIAATFALHGFTLASHKTWTDGTDTVLIADFLSAAG